MTESGIDPVYFSAGAAVVGCVLFLALSPRNPDNSALLAVANGVGLIFTALFCGVGAYAFSRNYFSKPDDYLLAMGVIPMISGFVLPSLLRGVAMLLKAFQTNPLGVASALLKIWTKRK